MLELITVLKEQHFFIILPPVPYICFLDGTLKKWQFCDYSSFEQD